MNFGNIQQNFQFDAPNPGNQQPMLYEVGRVINGCAYVPYCQSCISMFKNSGGISFSFTGCAMASFVYNRYTYITHICLLGPENPMDCRNLWNYNVQRHIFTNVRLFYPASPFLLLRFQQECIRRGIFIPEKKLNICGYIDPLTQDAYSALIDLENHMVLFEEQHNPHKGQNAIIGNQHIGTTFQRQVLNAQY